MGNREKFERHGVLKMIPLPKAVKEVIDLYFENRIPRASAALSFFLTLSVFPFLICANALLGSFDITEASIIDLGTGILPESTLEGIMDYFKYINENVSPAMISAALILTVSFSSAAYRTIMISMNEMQGKARYSGVFGTLFSFLFSLVFMGTIYIAGMIVVSGNWIMSYLGDNLDLEEAMMYWQRLKYIVLFFILLLIFFGVYRLTAPKEEPRPPRVLGAAIAAFAIVIVSIFFSWMIEFTASYSLVYGSLASFVVFMLWIYICGNIILMGNVLNIVRARYKIVRIETTEKGGGQ